MAASRRGGEAGPGLWAIALRTCTGVGPSVLVFRVVSIGRQNAVLGAVVSEQTQKQPPLFCWNTPDRPARSREESGDSLNRPWPAVS
jgi:hypothetical protein